MPKPRKPPARVVVKLGTGVLTSGIGRLNTARLAQMCAQLAALRAAGTEVIVVSSGAVGLGMGRLGLKRRPAETALKQACAAVGQSLLMQTWQAAFEPHGITVAQVLLTHEDLRGRARYLGVKHTLARVIGYGAVPIINENDAVSAVEIKETGRGFGDNDTLSAMVAALVGAQFLVILSTAPGLIDLKGTGKIIPVVERITPEIEAMAGGANLARRVGSGGMATKIAAASIAAAAGCATIVTLGRLEGPLSALETGAGATLFEASGAPAAAYKAWIAGSLAPHGALTVDDGAAAAIRAGKSLLAAGVKSVQGRFGKGDAVVVRDGAGREVGRGLARYDAADARRIVGLRSGAIETLLGEAAGPLIHADDLALGPRAP